MPSAEATLGGSATRLTVPSAEGALGEPPDGLLGKIARVLALTIFPTASALVSPARPDDPSPREPFPTRHVCTATGRGGAHAPRQANLVHRTAPHDLLGR
ncbi:hypothetical protein BN12_180021 [Nostocoides japonicum T1-X7]|uniref:Uncharacterized protein n=1 Tax=Nostocoides japonicum T1-X7 TaxID=1194083 RepID=A0A077LWS9_9MICO|nr:hypothetical protein BN12_180021 [Tetrasphaera japonica T1-X7]